MILKAVNYSENAHLLSNGKRAVHNFWDYLERNACALLHLLNPSHYVFKPFFAARYSEWKSLYVEVYEMFVCMC